MKFSINFKRFPFLPLITLMLFTACQNEVTEVTIPNNQQTISANSNLASLLSQTAALDGSLDNIIDYANCLSVDLPVTVIVNGVEIIIDSEEDFDAIEALFDEFNDDEDEIELTFPITIILSDYSEIVVQDYSELETYIEDCNGENEEDDDIECIDFQYPIVFSVYNSNFQVIETVTIENDEALYLFVESLEGGVLASLNFPVTLILSDGSTLEVNNNAELEAAIEAVEGVCDEDDDNDWNDDDCTEENIVSNLLECYWNIVAYNSDDIYIQYDIEFNENGSFEMHEGMAGSAIGGAWEMSVSNDGLPELVITQITAFQDNLMGSWVIVECDDDRLEMTMEGNTMVMEQDCTDNNSDCTQLQVEEFLLGCPQTPTLNNYTPSLTTFVFSQDNDLYSLFEGDLPHWGTWDISTDNNGVFIVIGFNGLDDFNGLWYVTACNENQLILEQDDNVLILESSCVENPFECFGSFEAELIACDDNNDGFEIFNLTQVFSNCLNPVTFNVTYHQTIADAESAVNAFSNPEAYTNITNPETIYVRVELIENSNVWEVFEINLIIEDCSSSCSEEDVDSYLLECIWNVVNLNGSDDLIIYDMDFESSGTVVIFTDTVTIDATWSTSQSASGVILEFGNVSGANIQAISGSWNIIDCDIDRLEMTQNDNTMVIEQDCD